LALALTGGNEQGCDHDVDNSNAFKLKLVAD